MFNQIIYLEEEEEGLFIHVARNNYYFSFVQKRRGFALLFYFTVERENAFGSCLCTWDKYRVRHELYL